MLDSFKVYKNQELVQKDFLGFLLKNNYRRVPQIAEEYDFSVKGRILELWPTSFENPVRIVWDFDKICSIKSFDVSSGLELWELETLIILPSLKRKIKKLIYTEELPLKGFVDLKKGDYVVHVNYGIGIYRGTKTIKKRKYFVVEYDQQDKLYVPIEDLHLIEKYISFWHRKPKLSRLGTKQWLRIKERAKKGIERFALELIRTEALRKSIGGFKFSLATPWQDTFNSRFPYEETPDQKKAWEDTKRDMESSLCMDRLLCGDVGYGKTEIALRAAFKAVMDSKQVAFLVPTTILAEQHHYNFVERTKEFPVRVEVLSRFVAPSRQIQILEDLKKGKVDIIIGTHRLLNEDVEFKDLGLLIIDEEQRFGVKAKERLKKIRANIDVLTLTATPIPRTLYMALSGIKDISFIKTPPKQRLAVKTFVCEFNQDLIRQSILRERERKGQIFFIHNRILDIEKIYNILRKILPQDFKIGCAYGKMNSRILEKTMLKFLKGELDILLSTNIIESGIDVPRAGTIIVNDAHMFGLADLHQLRGRVGRSYTQAYAYFLVPSFKTLPHDAKKRLEAIQKYSFLGAGFKIALQDLEIRGAGNILGFQQHGLVYLLIYPVIVEGQFQSLGFLQKEFILN